MLKTALSLSRKGHFAFLNTETVSIEVFLVVFSWVAGRITRNNGIL